MRTLSGDEEKRQALIFKALGHPTRLRIVRALEGRERCVGELVHETRLAWSSVSRHLAVLRQCGLIAERRRGAWVYHRLALPGALALTGTLEKHLADRTT